MANFSGLFATPVTAYDKNGDIDSEGIKRLVEFVSKNEIQNQMGFNFRILERNYYSGGNWEILFMS